jgi:pimeloyl-ACP methyl ester carboxylesterase
MRRRIGRPARLAIALGLALAVAGVALGAHVLGGSCVDVVAWQRRSLTRQLEGAGVSARVLQLGDDRVLVWSNRGPGPAVVLIHGFGASALWQWTPQAVALAPGHRVIMPDLLWFGGSSSTRRDYSVDHQAAAVVATLDALGVAEADLVGISYGGIVAYEIASARPERVRRLVLVDTPGRDFGDDDYAALLRRFDTDDFARVLLPVDDAGVRVLIELAYEHPPWTPDFALRQARRGLYAVNREELAALVHQLLADREALRARPTRVRCPALVVWGENDPVFPLAIGERLARSLGARLEVIADARHFPNAEHPEPFNLVLLEFLDSPRPSSSSSPAAAARAPRP